VVEGVRGDLGKRGILVAVADVRLRRMLKAALGG